MESSSHFSPINQSPESDTYKPFTELPAHLQMREKIAQETRFKMTPVMQAITELTDKMALRASALPQPE